MKIVDARWTRLTNMLVIQCPCGSIFEHRADHWWVGCKCGQRANLTILRERYVEQEQHGR